MSRVRLAPVDLAVAARLVAGDRAAVRAGRGYPHEDTADALRPHVESGDAEGVWFVVLDETGEVVGECGWRGGADAAGDLEIGYGLAAPYRGKGLGTEAVRQLLDRVAERPAARRVVAEVLADNLPSRRLLERLGFAVEDVDPPHVRYARAAIPV